MIRINRRTVLGGFASVAAFPGFAAATGERPDSITVTAFAGPWETVSRDVFGKDFTRRTGVPVNISIGAPAQWMTQIDANREKPPLHVLINSIDLALIAAKDGLVEEISQSKVSNLQYVPQKFTDMCKGFGTCVDYGTAGIVYHKRVENPPKSMKEFVEGTIAGKWRASLPGVGYQATKELLIWNLADVLGGSVDNVDPAFKAIKEMSKNAVFFNSVNQVIQHLQTGEADVGIMFDGRVWTEIDAGADSLGFINPAEGGIISPIVVQKVKNSPEIAWDYINGMLDTANQTEFAKIVPYGMTNRNTVYSATAQSRITDPKDTRWPPFEEIGPRVTEWLDRWNRELG
ncbi:extracellular solute-binding protein [Mesorhizobium sp. B2-6-5]|uniref:extracellular solute-binding protein n=1 Tax=Mesorhizobium sp. B2-6-5 TaxID=2589912 RepID=UPI0011292F3D|nr:extracellular solute-binding protein [Mesorhizobium sp. B2-6-5]TPJ38278.1 extracellular solute-binding protein [Mesorhizobium sp. B2-6-5]